MEKNYKTYPFPLTRDYCLDWTVLDAIREFIQNFLDSDEDFHYSYNSDVGVLYLYNPNTVLTPQTLLLGASGKRGDAKAAGKYGEGYKIALLILARAEMPVEIFTGNKLWTPHFSYSPLFGAETLEVREIETFDQSNSLRVKIHGVTQEMWATIQDRCLYLQEDLGEVLEVPDFGRVLLDKPRGHLYVGGLWVCETEMGYSYDFDPDKIELNRDRATVSSFELEYTVGAFWALLEHTERVRSLIVDLIHDYQNKDAKYFTSVFSNAKKEVLNLDCAKGFAEAHGDSTMLALSREEEALLTRQQRPCAFLGDTLYGRFVRAGQMFDKEKGDCFASITELKETPISLLENTYNDIMMAEVDLEAVLKKLEEVLNTYRKRGVEYVN